MLDASSSAVDAHAPGAAPRALKLFEFARGAGRIDGRTPLSAFPRLRDVLADAEGEPVAWSLRGWERERPGAAAQPMVTLELRAGLPLLCQRCLQPVVVTIAEGADFRLVRDEPELTQDELDAADEVLPAGQPVDVQELIEDQLLLALPIVPMHDICPEALPAGSREERAAAPKIGERQSPFANLRDLMKRGKPD